MNAVYANFQGCGFTFFSHHGLYFFLCLFHHLFDSGRMNSSVHNQFFQRNTCYFTPDRIETGQYDCFRGIVNNEIYARKCFQSSDIASFPTDNTALHFIAWKLYNGNCSFRYMVCRTFLNGCHHVFLGLLIGFLFCFALQFLVELGSVNFYFVLNSF